MNLVQALQIVLDLARDNAVPEQEAKCGSTLDCQRRRQQIAIKIVENTRSLVLDLTDSPE